KIYKATYSVTSPEVLNGAGLSKSPDATPWSFECGARKLNETVAAAATVTATSPVEAWWDLAPGHPSTGETPIALTLAQLRLYLRQPLRNYSFDFVSDAGILYFQYSRAQPDPALPIERFSQDIVTALRANPVRALVVDLRFNTGGDAGVA